LSPARFELVERSERALASLIVGQVVVRIHRARVAMTAISANAQISATRGHADSAGTFWLHEYKPDLQIPSLPASKMFVSSSVLSAWE
jgi:hypothetical protein